MQTLNLSDSQILYRNYYICLSVHIVSDLISIYRLIFDQSITGWPAIAAHPKNHVISVERHD